MHRFAYQLLYGIPVFAADKGQKLRLHQGFKDFPVVVRGTAAGQDDFSNFTHDLQIDVVFLTEDALQFLPQLLGQGGALPSRGYGDRQISPFDDGRQDKITMLRFIDDIHENVPYPGITENFAIDIAVIGCTDYQKGMVDLFRLVLVIDVGNAAMGLQFQKVWTELSGDDGNVCAALKEAMDLATGHLTTAHHDAGFTGNIEKNGIIFQSKSPLNSGICFPETVMGK